MMLSFVNKIWYNCIMKKIFTLLALPVLAGCLTSTPPSVSHWMLEYTGQKSVSATPKFGVTRVSQISVRSPYNVQGLLVLRSNGMVAVDPYNEYVTNPALLMKGVLFDALNASGKFKTVVGASSSATATASVELLVTKLALDCRTDGQRQAVATVVIRILDGHDIAEVLKGDGAADAADGNFGAALSKAVSAAMASALGNLR